MGFIWEFVDNLYKLYQSNKYCIGTGEPKQFLQYASY